MQQTAPTMPTGWSHKSAYLQLVNHIHHHHLLLLSPEADTHFTFYILQFIHFVSFPLSISCLNELISPLTKLACKSYCFTGDVKVCEYILVAIIVCVIRVAITASQCGCLIAICLNIMMSTWSHIHLSDVLIVK